MCCPVRPVALRFYYEIVMTCTWEQRKINYILTPSTLVSLENYIVAVQKVQKIQKFVTAANGEVLGASMLALPACLKANEIMPLLQRHGLAEIDPQKWYPQQGILNLYRDIEEGRSNVSENLVSIGIKSVETMGFPPEVNTMQSMIMAMAGSYDQVHRNIQPGEGTWGRLVGENHAQAILNTPYPDDVFYGYYWGLMKKYTPAGMRFRIAMAENNDPELPGTLYDITWGTNV